MLGRTQLTETLGSEVLGRAQLRGMHVYLGLGREHGLESQGYGVPSREQSCEILGYEI